MHVTMKSPEWVEDRFGEKIDGQSVSTNTLESRLLAVQGMTQDYDSQKAVEVREVWIRPNMTSKYPEGMLLYLTQDRILEAGPFPYQHGKQPFAKRTYIENSIFYGTTLVEDLMPLQVEYNRTRSQIIEDKNRMGRPQLAIERGSMDVKKLRETPGTLSSMLQDQERHNPSKFKACLTISLITVIESVTRWLNWLLRILPRSKPYRLVSQPQPPSHTFTKIKMRLFRTRSETRNSLGRRLRSTCYRTLVNSGTANGWLQ